MLAHISSNHSSSDRQRENSALGSWAGYIYQGLCGVYHALSLIHKDREVCKDFYLNLDSYEDFSILNGEKKIISLHQCKDEKQIKDYKSEQVKMKEKHAAYSQKDWLVEGCKMYFHNAHDITFEDNIEAYCYHNGDFSCAPNAIITLIKELVEMMRPGFNSVSVTVAKLVGLVEAKVLEVQGKFFETNEALRNIARREAIIPFEYIADLIYSPDTLALDKQDFFAYIKCKYCMEWQQIMDDYEAEGCSVNREKMENMIRCFRLIEEGKGLEFLQRLVPNRFVQRKLDSLIEVASLKNAQSLFNVLHDTNESLQAESFHWGAGENKRTPTTLQGSSERDIKRICRMITENSPNLDCLWEFAWLVGDVSSSIPSIADNTQRFNQLKENPDFHKSIFATKKVGILSITDKNNGTFD